jgi:hypothetical protein
MEKNKNLKPVAKGYNIHAIKIHTLKSIFVFLIFMKKFSHIMRKGVDCALFRDL